MDVLEVYRGADLEFNIQQLSGDTSSSSSFGSFKTNITAVRGCDPHLEEGALYILSGKIFFFFFYSEESKELFGHCELQVCRK